MNHNHHRIVFNAARGQLMAVSETASSDACSSASGDAPARTARPKRWQKPGIALLAFAAWSLPAKSQITADPSAAGNLRPTVLTAPNGVPLVNIQTPSAAGVSRNVYRQFDVGAQGATLLNRNGALLLSAGDMTLVATERLENRSADIEALGKLSITTPVLVNANDHISHTVVTDAATNHTVYHLASGTLDANDVAWSVVKPLGDFTQDAYDAHRREWLLPKTSAYADTAFKNYYLDALPLH